MYIQQHHKSEKVHGTFGFGFKNQGDAEGTLRAQVFFCNSYALTIVNNLMSLLPVTFELKTLLVLFLTNISSIQSRFKEESLKSVRNNHG